MLEKTEEMYQNIKRFSLLDKRFLLNGHLYELKIKGIYAKILWNFDLIIVVILILVPKPIFNLWGLLSYIFILILLWIGFNKFQKNILRRKLFFNTDFVEIKLVE